MSSKQIKVKYFRDTPFKLVNATDGDWVSVVNNGYTHYFGVTTPIYLRLGFALEIPEGYEAHFVSEWGVKESSGLSLVKGVEIVDNAYTNDKDMYEEEYLLDDDESPSDKDIRRELAFLFCSPERGLLPNGVPFLKFRLVKKQPDIVFEEVDYLDTTSN